MKKIEAYIRHEAFEPIRMELLELGFPSLSIVEVKGSGRQKGLTERYRGAELTTYLRPKLKIECVVATQDVDTVVNTILKHARTGSISDRPGCAWSVASRDSPVRSRNASSTGSTNTLPSPIDPVRACLRIVLTTVWTCPDVTTHSILTFGCR